MSAPQARTTTVVTNPNPVLWNNNIPFDGYLWLGLSIPSGYDHPSLWNSERPQAIPQFTKIPIIGGTIDPGTQVFYNSDINPPNTLYYAYWFDRLDRLVAPPSGTAIGFTIGVNPYIISVPTLIPAAVGQPPVPQMTPAESPEEVPMISSVLNVNLVHNVTTTVTTAYPPLAGVRLVVFATQDSSGNGSIAWDVMFKNMPTTVSLTANAVTVWDTISQFDPIDNKFKWYFC